MHRALNWLKSTYQESIYCPNWMSFISNPYYIVRKELYDSMKNNQHMVKGIVLDVGCGHRPYQHLFQVQKYIGLELDTPSNRQSKNADLFYDGLHFPLEQGSVDTIICNQVLEHVFNPETFLKEMFRVLKPSGRLLLTVPFIWEEHESPHDFGRYSSFGLPSLLKSSGFRPIHQEKMVTGFPALIQLALSQIIDPVKHSRRRLYWFFSLPFILIMNILSRFSSRKVPSPFYLDNFIVAERS
jgi:SAM-dependent methyltransferase